MIELSATFDLLNTDPYKSQTIAQFSSVGVTITTNYNNEDWKAQ